MKVLLVPGYLQKKLAALTRANKTAKYPISNGY